MTRTAATLRVRIAGAAHIDAHAIKHGFQRLLCKCRIQQRVAAVLQADDEAVAKKLVVTNAAQRGNILDSYGRIRAEHCKAENQSEADTQHYPPTRTVPSVCTIPEIVTPLSRLRIEITSPAPPA